MYSQIVILCCALIAGCYGFYINPFGRQQHICPLPSKPCRLQATIAHFNNTHAGQIETQTCSCNQNRVCSSDWSNRDHVISRNLISENYKMALNMMFCSPVQPQEYCELGQDALVLIGSTTIPTNIQSYNCRCRDDRPLQLKLTAYNEDHLRINTYVCSDHMATCAHSLYHCMEMRQESVSYGCKCRKGMHCRTRQEDWGVFPMYGYCEV